MSLKLVPFNPAWIKHDKIDIHGIYRRPRFIEDAYGERTREYDANGLPTWDLTGPLPIRQHVAWVNKGYEYVTLADQVSLASAARHNTLIGGTYAEYNQHQTGGPWNYKKYAEGQTATRTHEAEQLRADVEEFGSAAVIKIRRQTDPLFELPPHLQGVPMGGQIGTATRAVKLEGSLEPEPAAPKAKRVAWNKGLKGVRSKPIEDVVP